MMGHKERAFAPLPPVTLEDLVPPDHFYRHLERSLDLGFVRDLVRDAYAEGGRPSIDPVVFFKLHWCCSSRDALRAPAHAGGRRPAQPALVSRLRPDRTPARPLQPDPHPGALRAGDLPPLLRDGRGAMPRGRIGLGAGTLFRCHQGRGQRLARFGRPSLRRRGAPGQLFAATEAPGESEAARTSRRRCRSSSPPKRRRRWPKPRPPPRLDRRGRTP